MSINGDSPNFVADLLEQVRQQIAVDDDDLSETKARRKCVKRHARKYTGVARTFDSGSVAHGTVNKPISDADCGAVLDRRVHRELGPDGDDVAPNEVVDEVAALVIEGVREDYPEAEYECLKRAILIEFNEPLDLREGEDEPEDPSVDLIVALTRADGEPGLWIPNLENGTWDASDPEEHTRLLLGPTKPERVHRARVVRFTKASIKQDGVPALTSFNIEALALRHVEFGRTIAESIEDLLLGAATDLSTEGPTPDPAGVSKPLRLPDGMTLDRAIQRLSYLGERMKTANAASDDPDAVLAALSGVFGDFIEESNLSGKQLLAHAGRQGNVARLGAAVASPTTLKTPGAYGSG